ncbi:MAG TPA: alpha/beta hydrolase-fold protein [Rhodothermales bacterium]
MVLALLAQTPAAAQTDTVLFQIDLTALIEAGRFVPGSHGVGVRGGSKPLSWSETLMAADPEGDGIYEAIALFPEWTGDEQPVPYKFKTEDPAAAPNDGWEDGPNRMFVRTPGRQRVARAFGSGTAPLPPSTVGDIRAHENVPSKFVAARNVFVYLPPGYGDAPDRRYPVLYLHDGQNVFDHRSVGAEWRVDETAERLISEGAVDPFIVVAVSNTPARIDEYTPTSARISPNLPMTGGNADAYGRFLVEELKPLIDATYRTIPDAPATSLGGSSLGGLVTLYLGLQYPGTFGNLLVVSPSIWWENQRILRIAHQLPERTDQRIWLDMGTRESSGAIGEARLLRDALQEKGWTPGEDLQYVEDEGAGHTESAWAGRVEGMLKFLYGAESSKHAH